MVEEYAALPYSREQLPNIQKCDLQFVISDQLFLDVLRMKIRSKPISYAIMKKGLDEKREKDLENSIQAFETKMSVTEDEKGQLEHDRQELIAIRENRKEEVLHHSRARWIAEGEKITKYFCGLEKRNCIGKQMTKRTLSNGDETHHSKDTKNEVETFYEKLYSERQVEDFEISDMIEDVPMLTLQGKNSPEGEIILTEASSALKNMKITRVRWFHCRIL